MFDNYEKFKKDVYALTKIDLNCYKEKQMRRRISGSGHFPTEDDAVGLFGSEKRQWGTCLFVGCPKEDDEKSNDIDDEDAVALNLREWAFEQDADGKDDASGEDADADPVIAETLMEEDGKRYRQRS